jgi:hypothetical protein
LLASSDVNNAKRLREKMEKKKEKTMMMTLCLSDLEEWKKALRQKTRTKSRQNKRKKKKFNQCT